MLCSYLIIYLVFIHFLSLNFKMADEDLNLNEDQLLDNLEDVNGENDLLNEVSLCGANFSISEETFFHAYGESA